MALFDIFELTHKWRDNDGRECSNNYYYRYDKMRGLGVETDEEALAISWIDAVLNPSNGAIPNTYITYEVKVRNLFQPDYVWVEPMALVGGRSGAGSELMPQFNSVKVTLAHNSGLLKKGRKMFGGFFESDQTNGLLNIAGYTVFAIRAAMCMAWVADALLAGQKSFEPVVVKRVPIIVGGVVTGYRLPQNAGELMYASVLSAVASVVVTSQNTRKK